MTKIKKQKITKNLKKKLLLVSKELEKEIAPLYPVEQVHKETNLPPIEDNLPIVDNNLPEYSPTFVKLGKPKKRLPVNRRTLPSYIFNPA